MRAPPLAPSVPTEGETDNKSEPQNPERGQYVVGLSGTGKTHLAVSIARACIRNGRRGRFTTAAALVHELVEAVDDRRLQRLQKTLASQDLLIIDELGFVPLSKTGAGAALRDDLAALRAWLDRPLPRTCPSTNGPRSSGRSVSPAPSSTA
jgi:hypothetical protein